MIGSIDLSVRVCHGDPLVMAGLVALIDQEPGLHVQSGSRPDEGVVDVVVADHACALSLLASASASASASDPSGVAGGLRAPRVIVVTRRDKEGQVMQRSPVGRTAMCARTRIRP